MIGFETSASIFWRFFVPSSMTKSTILSNLCSLGMRHGKSSCDDFQMSIPTGNCQVPFAAQAAGHPGCVQHFQATEDNWCPCQTMGWESQGPGQICLWCKPFKPPARDGSTMVNLWPHFLGQCQLSWHTWHTWHTVSQLGGLIEREREHSDMCFIRATQHGICAPHLEGR